MPSTKTAKIVDGKTKNEGPSTKKGDFVDGTPKMDWPSTKRGDFVDGVITEYGKDYNKGQGTDDGRDQNSDF